ncbi:hypothetical protein ABZ714_12495 [Streptomyces sp. NPDC006798]|uniref:hypothetical protein n=1 Tax=Streptomyces sp. NPDC006798 TaxID=3155462 RepID=UPI003411C598
MTNMHPLAVELAENDIEFKEQLAAVMAGIIETGNVTLVPEWKTAVVKEADRAEFGQITPGPQPHHMLMVPNSASMPGGPYWLYPLGMEAWQYFTEMAEG